MIYCQKCKKVLLREWAYRFTPHEYTCAKCWPSIKKLLSKDTLLRVIKEWL